LHEASGCAISKLPVYPIDVMLSTKPVLATFVTKNFSAAKRD